MMKESKAIISNRMKLHNIKGLYDLSFMWSRGNNLSVCSTCLQCNLWKYFDKSFITCLLKVIAKDQHKISLISLKKRVFPRGLVCVKTCPNTFIPLSHVISRGLLALFLAYCCWSSGRCDLEIVDRSF